MALILALLVLAFPHPAIEPAKPGKVPADGAYVISPEGLVKFEKGKPQHPPKIFHPAFVLSMDTRFRIGHKLVETGAVTISSASSDTLQIRYSDGFVVRKGPAKILFGASEIGPAQTFLVSPGGDEYLLLQWIGKCESSFTLFLLDSDKLKEVSTNSYGCRP